MKEPLPAPKPFKEGPVADMGQILDVFNRRRAQKGWSFGQLDDAMGTPLNLNAMIRRGTAAGASLFRIAEALGLEIVVRAKGPAVAGRRERMRQLRNAAQSDTESGEVPEE